MSVEEIAGDSVATVEQEVARALDLDAAPVEAEEEDESQEVAETEAEATETEATETEPTAGEVEYLNQFADMLEDTTEESLYGLKIKSGLHQDKSYTIGELKDLADRREAFEEEQSKFEAQKAETVKEIETLKSQAQASITTQQNVPDEIRQAEAKEQAIVVAHNAIKWDELKEQDPAQYAALKLDYQAAYQQAKIETQDLKQKFDSEFQENFKKYQASQWQETVKRIPEWKDQKSFEADHNDIYAMAGGYGYTPQEVNTVIDPRLRQLLRDYTKLKQTIETADAEAKKVTERGNPILKTNFRPKKKGRTQQTIERAKAPNATRKDKLAAERELLESVPGFL